MRKSLTDTLQKAPNDCWYAIESIGRALRQNESKMYANAATEVLTKIIADFKSATKELGEDWQQNDGLVSDLPDVEYAIEQLGKFLRREECDILSAQAATVFLEFLRSQLKELVVFAQTVDRQAVS
jgi:hypothetical protein